jgi:hypothetical protein
MSDTLLTIKSMKLDSEPPNPSLLGSAPDASLEPALELDSPPLRGANPAPNHPRTPKETYPRTNQIQTWPSQLHLLKSPISNLRSRLMLLCTALHHIAMDCTTLHRFCSHAAVKPFDHVRVNSSEFDFIFLDYETPTSRNKVRAVTMVCENYPRD